MISVQGLGRPLRRAVLPLHGEHQAQQRRAVRWPRSSASSAVASAASTPRRARRLRRGHVARAPRGRAPFADGPRRCRAQSRTARGASAEALRSPSTSARVIAVVGVMADKDLEGILEAFAEQVDVVVATAADVAARHARRRAGPRGRRGASVPIGSSSMPRRGRRAWSRPSSWPTTRPTRGASAAVVVIGSVALAGQARHDPGSGDDGRIEGACLGGAGLPGHRHRPRDPRGRGGVRTPTRRVAGWGGGLLAISCLGGDRACCSHPWAYSLSAGLIQVLDDPGGIRRAGHVLSRRDVRCACGGGPCGLDVKRRILCVG